MSSLWLYALIGGFMGGVLWRSLYDFGDAFLYWLFALGVSFVVAGLLSRTRVFASTIALVFFAAALGVLRTDASEPQVEPKLAGAVGAAAVVEGVLVDEPDERENHTKLTVAVHSVNGETLQSPTRVLAVTDLHPRRSYGDVLRIEGVLERPENFEGDTGRVFDYVSYLEKDDVRYLLFYPTVEVLGTGAGNPVKAGLFSLKHAFLENIQKVIPDPQSSLLGGLVVGAKQSLGEELLNMFRTTGIIHIVVLSGYNVTIVAEGIMRSLAFLPQVWSMALGGGAIVLFAIMTGGSATIVRASLMALIVLLARATGRTYEMFRALMIAGALMVAHNPEILVHDPSFQLSFLATLGLILVAPKVEPYLSFISEKFQLRSIAAATLSTQLFVLPWILYLMGELSIVALPVNLLVLVTVPATMLLGFLAGAIGFVSPILALPFAYLAHALLSYQLWISGVFASFPFAAVTLETFPLAVALTLYLLYGLLLSGTLQRVFRFRLLPSLKSKRLSS